MRVDKRLSGILDNACAGIAPGRDDCAYMLAFDENSMESQLMRAVATNIIRNGNDNSAIILGQIGLEMSPCPGNCGFCSFGRDHTNFKPYRVGEEDFIAKLTEFTKDDDLYGLYLMCMHEYDLNFFLDRVRLAKKLIKGSTQLLSNVGDSDIDAFMEMKKAGITGVYHVCRIDEGCVTSLSPEQRIKTMQNALDAGLQIFTCLEPIGPEHTIQQLVDNMFIGIEHGCTQHAAMRREPVPGSPLARHGQISNLRLGQITAVVALATFSMPTMTYMGVHEPTEIGYVSGANVVTAETGVNPRDHVAETSANRGMDMAACRRMLFDSGFKYIRRGNETKIPLTLDYVQQHGSTEEVK